MKYTIRRKHRKPRALVINAYFDPWRNATPTRFFVPRAMAPYFLAGHFDPDFCDVAVWDEAFHGALLDTRLFADVDFVVFTGLTAAFDRARQLRAYAKHTNPDVVTIIGGPIARALPSLCGQVFDEVCLGDAESITHVISDLIGPDACLPFGAPRFDLTVPKMGLGFIESTTNCNFACSFCSLTGEDRPYVARSREDITRQLDAMGKVHGVMLLDNNFYGNNRKSFEARVTQIGDRVRAGQFKGWGCLVTGDFFANPDNIKTLADNGCLGLFSGVETLDPKILRSYNKKQSLISHPLELTRVCAENGILFDYGMMVDFSRQTMAEIDEQISGILDDIRMRLPAFISVTIPILGTPYFDEALSGGRILPNVLLSDLDGMKLVERPLEPLGDVAAFYGHLINMRGRQRALIRHAFAHALHWRRSLPAQSTLLSLLMPLHRFRRRRGVGTYRQMRMTWREARPTYSATSDARRLAYTPRHTMPAEFEADFTPLLITDAEGRPAEALLRARERPGASYA